MNLGQITTFCSLSSVFELKKKNEMQFQILRLGSLGDTIVAGSFLTGWDIFGWVTIHVNCPLHHILFS